MAKLGVIVCVHNSERSDIEPRSIWPLEKRWFTNAPTRMTAFASAMEARGDLDFCADLGDLVSAESQQALTELTEITDCLENNWLGKMHYVLGNHGVGLWKDNWADYESEISQSPPGGGNFWTTGKPSGWPNTTAYSFDEGGIHFVLFANWAYYWNTDERTAFLTWLAEDMAAASFPIVILTHHHLDNSVFGAATQSEIWEETQAVLENYNVQAVLTGHFHPVPRYGPFMYVKAEIPYFHLRGNLLGPMDGSEPIASDAAYYVFDIKPNAVQGRNKMKANIKVECHYTPQEDLNAASMNKEFATFLPMVA